jgi:hypothetical protein
VAVHVGELTSTVETEGPVAPPAAPAAQAPDEDTRRLRDTLRRLRRDEARTSSQEQDD